MDLDVRIQIQLNRVDGYGEICIDQISLMKNFALIWPRFEQVFCNRDANQGALKTAAEQLGVDNPDLKVSVEAAFIYFRERYWLSDLALDRRFELCGQSDNEPPNKIHKALNLNFDPEDITVQNQLVTCFWVIYRLRNNFLHGNKYEDLSEQKDNFEFSLDVMLSSLEAHFA